MVLLTAGGLNRPMIATFRSPDGLSTIPLVLLAGALLLICPLLGCQSLAPPQGGAILMPTAPVVVEPTAPAFTGPAMTLPSGMVGGVPGFPEPLTTTQPPPFASPAFAGPPVAGVNGAIAPQFGLPVAEATAPAFPNPVKVPVGNHDFAWDQIVDVVSDYFPIASEQRVQLTSNLWTEGRIETPYQSGATMFEPQKRDSVGSFNRWQGTLQTIRRRAVVRVVPEPDGYFVGVEVYRELEDLPKPEHATAGAASFRNDNSLPTVGREAVSRTRSSPLWIPLGRDAPLEQQILADIQARIANAPRVPMSVTPVP
ncbi:MAG: hypothetical protein ACR2NU_05545 [Aeoliella sp.]